MRRRVLVVAGEESGDQHAARLLRTFQAAGGDAEFFGIGGDALRAAGMRTIVDERELAVLGFWEVLVKYRVLRAAFDKLVEVLKQDPPDAVLLVDYPGFNLRLAKVAAGLGIPVWYYIGPQVWAWNRRRIPRMAETITRLMVIFPFETEVFKGTPLKVTFVGHPFVESIRKTLAAPEAPLPWPAGGAARVAILPGSRRQEIRKILPGMLAAAREIRRRGEDAVFLIAASSEARAELIRGILAKHVPAAEQIHFAVVVKQMREVVRQARAAMVCSGTATVETGLLGCPMIIAYRAAWVTYCVGRLLIKVKWLGMVNLVANRTLCPEFIQQDMRAERMADTLIPLLSDTPERQAQIAGLAAVRDELEGKGLATPPGEVLLEELQALPPRRGAAS